MENSENKNIGTTIRIGREIWCLTYPYFFIGTVKTRTVLKRAGQGLSDNWCIQWVKSWGYAVKVMFSIHDLKT